MQMVYFTHRKLKCLFAFILCLSVIVCGNFVVSAKEDLQTPAYTNYFYEQNGEEYILVEDRPVYDYETDINGESLGINSFYHIEDMYEAPDGRMFILDSGNNRVVVLKNDFTFDYCIEELKMNGAPTEMNSPKGIYVSENNEMFISDTENERVLICDLNGEVKKELTMPDSELIPEDFKFNPISVIIDNSNYFYVLTRGSYYGAMMYNEDYEFVGFFGANAVETTALEGIALYIKNLFTTNAQRASSTKKLPFQFYDFDIDNDGFIYTISPSTTGQIKKLNLKGTNTLRYKVGTGVNSATTYNFASDETYSDITGHKISQSFSSICVDKNGFVYALDSAYGQVYVYDRQCNNISVFGGGVGNGKQSATFVNANAIEIVDEKLLISDYEKNSITVMSKTEYGDLIMQGDMLTYEGEFDKAVPIWEEVLTYNTNRQIAYRGLALAALNSEDYSEAMKYAKLGLDQESYSAAYEQIENQFMNKHLWWILILIVGAVIFFVIYSSKKKVNEESKKVNPVKTLLAMSVHPFEVSQKIRYKEAGSAVIATCVIILFYLSSVAAKLWSGFMYTLPVINFNLFYALLGSVGIVLLWVICHWGISTIFTGKADLKQIYITTAYCLVPLVIYNVLFIVLSYIVIPTGASFIDILQLIFYIYTAFLLICSFINIQEYSLKKLLGISILTIAGMIAVAFLLFMVFMLGQNFVSFVVNIVSEAVYR